MKNLLTFNYWFNLQPEFLNSLALKLFLALIVGLGVAALILALIKKRGGIYRGLLKRSYGFCLSNAIIGLILLFFNYELVPFLSARFWLGFWFLEMIIWFIFILKNLKNIPKKKKLQEQEKELKKYIP